MKTLLLLLAAVAWAAATLSSGSRRGMSVQREYWYEYDSQMLTGIQVVNKQYSGLKVRARVMLQKNRDEYITLKVSDCRVYKVKEDAESWRDARVESTSTWEEERSWEQRGSTPDRTAEEEYCTGKVAPTAWLPESLLEELPSEHRDIVVNELIKPIRFRYESGLITKVYAEESEPYWSVNIKKGILSLFYLDLNAANQVTDVDVSPSTTYMDVIRPDYTTMAAKTGFKVKEPSPIGSCETFYSITPDHTLSELRVKKVPNTKKCVPKIMAESGLFSGILAGPGESNTKKVIIEPSISTDYLLMGSRHDFLLKKALLSAKYTVAPSSKSAVGLDGFVLQRLTFVKEQQIEREVEFERNPVLLRSGLLQYVPLASEISGVHSQPRSSPKDVSAKIELIDGLLDAICEKSREGIEKEVPDMISAIVTVLRKCSKEDIKEVIDTYLTHLMQDPASWKKKDILLDVIASVPHPEIASIVNHLIKEGKLSGMAAALTINQVSMTAPPSPAVVSEYLEMSRSSAVKGQRPVFKAVVLGMCAVCNKMVNIHKKMGIETGSATPIVKDVVKELKSLLQSGDKETRVLAVKAMGNLGEPAVLSDLERIIKDKSESCELRKLAIYSCKKICRIMPKVITNLLLPIYMRQEEPAEVRVAAFLMMMECRPGYSTLHVISSSLEEEKEVNVATFVYTYLQNIARTEIPELKPIKRLVIKILKVTRNIKAAALLSSGSKRFEVYSDSIETAFDVEFNVLRKARSVLPSSFVSRIHMHCFGTALNFGEIGIHMEGVNEIMRKLVGTDGILSDILLGRKDIASVIERISRPEFGDSAREELERILSKVELREITNIDLMKIMAYVRIFDNEYGFVKIDKESVSDALTKAKELYREWMPKLARGVEINAVKSIAFLGNSMIIPTPVGLPLILNTSVVGMIKAKGRVALEGFSSIASIWNGSPAKVKVDLRPTIAIKRYHNLGIATDIFEMGTTLKRIVHVDVPVDIEAEINLSEKKIIMKTTMPKSVSPSAILELKPSLYSLIEPLRPVTVASYKTLLPRTTEIDCSRLFKETEVEKEFRIPIIGSLARARFVSSTMDPSLYDAAIMYAVKTVAAVSMEPRPSGEKVVVEICYGETCKVENIQRSSGWLSGWWSEEEEVQERSSSRSDEEFLSVSPKSSIQDPKQKKIFVDIKYEGRSSTPMIATRTVLVHNPSMTKCQVNLQVIASGIEGMERSAKVMVDAFVNVPNVLKVILASKELPAPTKEIASVEVGAGKQSMTDNRFTFKVFPYKASADSDVPEEYGLRPIKHMPVKSINIKIISEANERAIENVKEFYRQLKRCKYMALYKPVLPKYSYMTEPLNSVSGKKTIICLQFIPIVGKLNCLVACPYATTYMMDQPIPSMMKPQVDILSPVISPKEIAALPSVSSLTRAPRDIPSAFYGVCKLRPTYIETLHKLSLTWSGLDESCEMVLAHDCSPQKLYTVTSSPVKASGVRKIKIIIPGFKIVTGEEMIRGQSSVKINDEIIRIEASQPLIRTRVTRDGSEVKSVRIERVEGDRLVIDCPEVGLAVESNGRFVDVKVSPLLARSTCGVCSHTPSVHAPISSAVGLGSSKLAGPFSIREFVHKYLVSSASCPASSAQSTTSSGTCSTRRRNIVISRSSDEVCFSVRPVDVCSDFCHPSRSLPMSIGFHCMSAEDSLAKTLLRERHERILTELTNKMAHVQRSVDIAQECIKV